MSPSVTGRRINVLGDVCGTANAEVVGFPSSSLATDKMCIFMYILYYCWKKKNPKYRDCFNIFILLLRTLNKINIKTKIIVVTLKETPQHEHLVLQSVKCCPHQGCKLCRLSSTAPYPIHTIFCTHSHPSSSRGASLHAP